MAKKLLYQPNSLINHMDKQSNKQYIGQELVLNVVVKDDIAHITFKKGKKVSLPKPLFDIVVTTELQEGEYLDVIYDKVARYLLMILVDFKVPANALSGITTRMIGIYNNVAKEVIGKKFGYEHESEILISDVIK